MAVKIYIKRLDLFLLQRFIPLLVMTFFICLFVVMMQFVYRFIEDLVGKGLSPSVIAELFWYAALTMVPIALPLAVVLASLMTFGNLGEHFELTAMKSAGISLPRIMAPLVILMVFISIGAFFFQNDVTPYAQTKMYTLLLSMRQKSPEVEIPEQSFYNEIPGMNLYVEKKNPDTGMLYGMIVYDISRGMDNARVILADSGKISFTEDKNNLFLHLHGGELFENVRDNSIGMNSRGYLPFRRETFTDKKVYIAFDANFNRIDEGGIRNQYVGRNLSELQEGVDSIHRIIDSIGAEYGKELRYSTYVGTTYNAIVMRNGQPVSIPNPEVHPAFPIDVDSVFASPSASMSRTYLTRALMSARMRYSELEFKGTVFAEHQKILRKHIIEMQKKFTLSLACLIFFFIGAPLGAIVKRGGLGYPLVLSVLLFTVYFIIDNIGQKMASDGVVDVWQGMWLSSIILIPLGIFITTAATRDRELVIKNPFARRKSRNIPLRTIAIDVPTYAEMQQRVSHFAETVNDATAHKNVGWYAKFFRHRLARKQISVELEDMIDYLAQSTDVNVIKMINSYPVRIDIVSLERIKKINAQLLTHLHENAAED